MGSFGFVAKLSFSGCFLDCGPGTSETSPKVDKADPWVMAQQGLGRSGCGRVASDISHSCLFKATVVPHCSKTSGLYQIMLEPSPKFQKAGRRYHFLKELVLTI